jgi:hypothetical protein
MLYNDHKDAVLVISILGMASAMRVVPAGEAAAIVDGSRVVVECPSCHEHAEQKVNARKVNTMTVVSVGPKKFTRMRVLPSQQQWLDAGARALDHVM